MKMTITLTLIAVLTAAFGFWLDGKYIRWQAQPMTTETFVEKVKEERVKLEPVKDESEVFAECRTDDPAALAFYFQSALMSDRRFKWVEAVGKPGDEEKTLQIIRHTQPRAEKPVPAVKQAVDETVFKGAAAVGFKTEVSKDDPTADLSKSSGVFITRPAPEPEPSLADRIQAMADRYEARIKEQMEMNKVQMAIIYHLMKQSGKDQTHVPKTPVPLKEEVMMLLQKDQISISVNTVTPVELKLTPKKGENKTE